MKKGAIFDMDGLLFDTERLFQEVWRQIARDMGVTLPPDFTTRICGTSGKKHDDLVRSFYPGCDPKELVSQVRNAVFSRQEIPVMKGVVEILSGMKEHGFRMAVASSSPLPMIKRNLSLTGLDGYFPWIVSGAQVTNGKPAPDIFLLAASTAGVDPSDCYVFEDSINGVIAGNQAGCASIMIPDLIEPNEEAKKAAAGIYPDLSAAWRAILSGEV